MTSQADRQGEERYSALMKLAFEGIFLADGRGSFVEVNPSGCLLAGYTREELLGKGIADLTPEEERLGMLVEVASLLPGTTRRIEGHMRCKDGSLLPVEWNLTVLTTGDLLGVARDRSVRSQTSGAALRDAARPVVGSGVVFRDETDRGHLEEQLQQIERKYRSLVNSNIIGVIVADARGRIYEANERFSQMVGYSKEELFSPTFNWQHLNAPEYRNGQAQVLKVMATAGAIPPWEKEYIRKDGSRFPVLVGGAIIDQERGLAVTLVLDISEQKAAERRKQEFLSMVGHELRTPITAILGYVELAQLSLEGLSGVCSAETTPLIGKIETLLRNAGQQIDLEIRLVEDLLDVSRMEQLKFRLSLAPYDLLAIVRETVAAQQHGARRRVDLALPPQASLLVVVDGDRIGQALSNYLTNAFKYSPADQVVSVDVKVEGTLARVSVRDQGPGLTAIQQQRIWERFYQAGTLMTQGSEQGGLGLGLSIVKAIVEQHQGQVGVESQPDQGATFWFSLPLAN
jgi:PAS domain S-box-containing protein